MRSTPAIDEAMRRRLREAVDRFAAGNLEEFGRMLGYANGGYIRQSLTATTRRPVRAAIISRMNDHPSMKGWFDGVMTPLVASDLRQSAPAARGRVVEVWPFKRLTREEWDSLGELQVVVEDAAVNKARQLLAELEAQRHRRRAK